MASTIILSGLTDYVNELSPEIYTETVIEGKFLAGTTHQPGIKNAEKVNAIRSTLVLQSPVCGGLPSATGSVTPFQNTLTVCPVEVVETLCVIDFELKYYGMYAKMGSYNEDVTPQFAAAYLKDKTNKTQAKIEDLMIKGSTTGTFSATNTTCNGLLHLATLGSGAASMVTLTASSAYSTTTAVAWINTLVAARPAELHDVEDMTLFLSWADYETYVQALIVAFPYLINLVDHQTGAIRRECMVPGTNVRVVATRGFNGITGGPGGRSKWFLLTPYSNIVYGYDDLRDSDKPQLFYSELTDQIVYRLKWKMGVQFVYNEYVVVGSSN